MAMMIALIFKTPDDMDDDKEAKQTAASPQLDEVMEIDQIIKLGKWKIYM